MHKFRLAPYSAMLFFAFVLTTSSLCIAYNPGDIVSITDLPQVYIVEAIYNETLSLRRINKLQAFLWNLEGPIPICNTTVRGELLEREPILINQHWVKRLMIVFSPKKELKEYNAEEIAKIEKIHKKQQKTAISALFTAIGDRLLAGKSY